jgi:hypothetical protein
MRKPYQLISDKEPSDQELADLMRSVLSEVKAKAKAADQKFQSMHLAGIKAAQEKKKQSELLKTKHERA